MYIYVFQTFKTWLYAFVEPQYYGTQTWDKQTVFQKTEFYLKDSVNFNNYKS